MGVVAEGDGIARMGFGPALSSEGQSGGELGCPACADVAMEPATRQAMDRGGGPAGPCAEPSPPRGVGTPRHAADAASPLLPAGYPCAKGNPAAGHAIRTERRRVQAQAAKTGGPDAVVRRTCARFQLG